MQERPPPRVMVKIVRYAFGQQNLSGVGAIHDALGDVYARARNVGLLVEIGDLSDRAAVNTHSDSKLRMTFQRFADFDGTQNRRFRIGPKYEGAAIARRQPQQFVLGFSFPELFG